MESKDVLIETAKSYKMFIVTMILIIMILLIVNLRHELDLPTQFGLFILVILTLIFVVNVIGVIIGITELKKKQRATYGLVGNLMSAFLYLGFVYNAI